MNKDSEQKKEKKRRFQLWIRPSSLEQVDKLLDDADCSSRSEFIESAIQFYVGYLSAKRSGDYIPNVVLSSLKSIVAESDNRQNRMLFKLAVELAIVQNLIATNQEVDKATMERLRGSCVNEVKRLNGSFSFEDALEWQQG